MGPLGPTLLFIMSDRRFALLKHTHAAAAASVSQHIGVTVINPKVEDDATLFYTPVAIIVSDVRAHITGGTSVTVAGLNYALTGLGRERAASGSQ